MVTYEVELVDRLLVVEQQVEQALEDLVVVAVQLKYLALDQQTVVMVVQEKLNLDI